MDKEVLHKMHLQITALKECVLDYPDISKLENLLQMEGELISNMDKTEDKMSEIESAIATIQLNQELLDAIQKMKQAKE